MLIVMNMQISDLKEHKLCFVEAIDLKTMVISIEKIVKRIIVILERILDLMGINPNIVFYIDSKEWKMSKANAVNITIVIYNHNLPTMGIC